MKRLLFHILPLLSMGLFIISGCGGGDSSSGDTRVVISLNNIPSHEKTKLDGPAPSGITSIVLTVTSLDGLMTPITDKNIPLDGSELVLSVPAGKNRIFKADAYEGTTKTYSGSTTKDLNAGEETSVTISLYEILAPSGPSVSINSGASSTNSQVVTLSISATDSKGVTGYYISEDSTTPSASASGWVSVTSATSYSASISYTLSSVDGTKTVYVWFKDDAGNVSASANDSIVLDTTAPASPSVSINSGATSTTTVSVTLTLSATDSVGVTGYYASETSTTPSASGWVSVTSATSYSASISYTLSSVDGTKTVYVWFKDDAGNVSVSASDSITLDTTVPTVSSTSPTSNATSVAISTSSITATFSETMDSSTITDTTFTVSTGGNNITGTVTYSDKTATFTPSSSLSSGTTYTATITTGVKDTAGNAMASNYTWSFTTYTSGTLDTAFGNSGILKHTDAAKVSSYTEIKIYSITTDSSGNILVAGSKKNSDGDYDMIIWRYKSDGTLDTTFGSSGLAGHSGAAGGTTGDDIGYSLKIDSSGKILVAGSSVNSSGNADMVIWRYKSDGILDTTFDSDGIAVHSGAAGGSAGDDIGYSITTDSSENILVAGYSINASGNKDMVIWKYDSNGSLVSGFGSGGIVVHSGAAGGSAGDDIGYSITTSSGNILVTGYSKNSSGNADMVIWKYDSNGSLVSGFDSDGIVIYSNTASGSRDDIGLSITTDSSGRILVTGYSESSYSVGNIDMVIWRYNSDGTQDTTFDSDGIAKDSDAAGTNLFLDINIGKYITTDSSGRILVTGTSFNTSGDADMVIWRYNSDGTQDTTFDSDGVAVSKNAAGGTGDDVGTSLTLDSSGRILVTGYSRNASGNDDMVIWRYR